MQKVVFTLASIGLGGVKERARRVCRDGRENHRQDLPFVVLRQELILI